MLRARSIVVLLILGAAGGTLGDWTHVATETLSYPGGGQPFWVPFLFAGAVLSIGVSHNELDVKESKSLPWIVGGVLGFLLLYAASGIAPGPVTLVVGVAFWGLDRTWRGLALALATAVVGVGVETLLITIGAFEYAPEHRQLGVVPYWLPALYVAASFAVGNLGRRLMSAASRTQNPAAE